MEHLLAAMESAMLDACGGSACSTNPVAQAVLYHISSPGNRLRALLCLDACLRLGVSETSAISAATTCELLHNASLLHDDLMDRSTTRRGQSSTWSEFGDGVAICAGDLMLSAAYAAVQTVAPARLIPEVVQLVHARTRELICGQAQEMDATARPRTLEQYEVLAVGKSASLISLSLQMPLVLAGLNAAVPLAQEVAESFAVVYQIADDLRDVEEDRLANCLNVVQVLVETLGVSTEEARYRARVRAEKHLDRFLAAAKHLPSSCGAVLVRHVATLESQLPPELSAAAGVRV